MPNMMEYAEKMIGFLVKKSARRLEKSKVVLKLLKVMEVVELKDTFESIYVHALTDYAVEAPAEMVRLFASEDVQTEFQKYYYQPGETSSALSAALYRQFQILTEADKKDKHNHLKKVYTGPEAFETDIQSFKAAFERFTHQSSPGMVKQINEMNSMMLQLLEDQERKSFPYQMDRYLERLRAEFQKEYLDENKYIDLNGETRFPQSSVPRYEVEAIHFDVSKDRDAFDYFTVPQEPLDKLVYEWLEKEADNLLVIIGEYGTGKTTFLRHMAHQLAVKALKNNGPKPLYFPLREFESSLDAFINNRFIKEGISDMDFPRFLECMEAGEFVLMLDGFDEMTQKIDYAEKRLNFDKLRAVLDKCPNGKVILTTREEYFKSDSDFHGVFRRYRHYFIAHMRPFDDEQIQQFLKTHTPDPDFYWEQIKKIFDLHDLAKRPVLLQLIVDHLPGLIAEKGETQSVNASDLYRLCIEDELGRKSKDLDFYIPGKYRLNILRDLAVWMFLNDVLTVAPVVMERELNLKQYFNTKIEWEFEKHLNEFLTFTFLLREGDHHYRISHKSFRDYLTAQAFTYEINSGEVKHFGKAVLADEIHHFILEQAPAQDKLLHLVETARDLPEEKHWQGTNAARILLELCPNALKGRNLSDCRLTNVEFRSGCDLTGTDFRRADLRGCLFGDKTLLAARLEGVMVEGTAVYLGVQEITDVAPLREMTQLERLYLDNNQLTNVAPLRELAQLRELHLHHNQLTDVTPLREMTQLKKLWLDSNNLTDVTPLLELTQLETLWLNNNPIPTFQIRALRKALPECQIEF